MKRKITEEEKKNIKNLHSIDESLFADVIDRLKSSDAIKNLKDKFGSLLGLDSDEKGSSDKTHLGSKLFSGKDFGKVQYVGKNMNAEQKSNMNLILNALEDAGVTDPKAQVGILSVIKKESNFKLQDEIGYCNTSDSRIVDVFGNRRGNKCKALKCNDAKFFDCLYGYQSGVKLGNTEPGDGYKYLGRGFHGLTGKANYKKYGISDPFSLGKNPNVAAKEVASFFKDKTRNFNTKEDAVRHFNNINSGGSQFGLQKALDISQDFEIK